MSDWSTAGHTCHLVREEGAAYDCCSRCYTGGYIVGKPPATDLDAGNLDIKALCMVSEWMGSAETAKMEQVIDDLGDICYVQTFSCREAGTLKFHFALEENPKLEIYPFVDNAHQSVRVAGPDQGRNGKTWQIDMPASSEYRINFKWDYSGKKLEWQAVGRQLVSEESASLVSVVQNKPAYSIMCSSLGWCMVDMIYNEDDELYEAAVDIGLTGEESFFFVSNNDLAQSIFPSIPKALDASASIVGPASNTAGNAWLLQGRPGEMCKITIRISELPFITTLYITTHFLSRGESIWEFDWNKSEDTAMLA